MIRDMAAHGREEQADRAAASGDLATARLLLEQEAQSKPSDPALWLKLSALRRAGGDVAGALAAIERSLTIRPRDFAALLHRAMLLEQLGDRRCDEAFGHAIAQLPSGAEIPAAMRSAVAHARERWEQHSGAVERRLRDAIPDGLSPLVRERAERLASNSAHTTRHFRQEPTEFHYPGVPEIEFYDRSALPKLQALDAATDVVRGEFDALMRAEAAEMVPYIQYPEHVPLRAVEGAQQQSANGPPSTCCRTASGSKPTRAIARRRSTAHCQARPAANPRRVAQRDVLAACAAHAHPAASWRRQHSAGLPPAPDRSAGLRLQGRRNDPRVARRRSVRVRRYDRARGVERQR